MRHAHWKDNWAESRQHYLDWWDGKGLVVSMWEHLLVDGPPHEVVPQPPPARDLDQYWFDPEWRAANLHYRLSRSSLKADIPAVANTHLGPGSLAAILGSELEGSQDTIWIHPRPDGSDAIVLDPNNKWWRLHLDLVSACQAAVGGAVLRRLPRPDRGPRHAGRAARDAGRPARHGGPPRRTRAAAAGGERHLV